MGKGLILPGRRFADCGISKNIVQTTVRPELSTGKLCAGKRIARSGTSCNGQHEWGHGRRLWRKRTVDVVAIPDDAVTRQHLYG